MMGTTHIAAGGATWLAGCAVAAAVGYRPSLAFIVVGTVVCAGSSLAPDFDHPGATVARTCGRLSKWAARLVARLSAYVYAETCTDYDRSDADGHRTLTHAMIGALAIGPAIGALMLVVGEVELRAGRFHATGGQLLGGWLVFASLVLVQRGWTGRTRVVLPVAATLVVVWWIDLPEAGWWLGAAVTAGCLSHQITDAFTLQGCPLFWPLPVMGQRWYPVRLPERMRIRTGRKWERRLVLYPSWVLVVAAAGWLVVTSSTVYPLVALLAR